MYNKTPWPSAQQPGMMPMPTQMPSGMPMPMPMPATMPMSMPMPMPIPAQIPTTLPAQMPSQGLAGVPIAPGAPTTTGAFVPEESYVENILRMNLGKVATLYMTYENNSEWNAKIFKGVLEAAGRDHIIISDPATGKRYLLLTLNLNYITFDEPLNYTLPFGTAPTTL